jgi:hypothetical protein
MWSPKQNSFKNSFSYILFLFLVVCPIHSHALSQPVLLLHGASRGGGQIRIGNISVASYFAKVRPIFENKNVEVFAPDIPMLFANRQSRILFLHNFVEKNLKGRAFHIVAHSLSGVDARLWIQQFPNDPILSLTTIASPHRGTPIANFFMRALDQKNLFYYLPRVFGYKLEQLGFLPDCTRESMDSFNREVPDTPTVAYYSVVSYASPWWWQMSPILWPLAWFVFYGDPNFDHKISDGVVPMSSQSWGKVILTTQLDHLGQLNYHWLRFPQNATSRQLYQTIISNLEALEKTKFKL